MEILNYPSRQEWPRLCQRACADDSGRVTSVVHEIIDRVAADGDKALLEYEQRFTGAELTALEATAAEIDEAEQLLPEELKRAINTAADNIKRFHSAQMPASVHVTTMPGVECMQRAMPIQRVGLYIPGGNSPLFSTVLMLAVPAGIAGCRDIVMCTPAGADGKIHPAILYAAKVAGVHRIFKTGGAQAIAAMAIGTESIPAVYKIFGPGNRYVMEAKQQVTMRGVAIDMPAGPSEVMVIADDGANLDFVAADFLSQAEHGPDSQSILLTTDDKLATLLPKNIEYWLNKMPRAEMMKKSLEHSRIITLNNYDEVMDFANLYAPEHLIINTRDAERLAERVENAGSVFLGQYSPESAGDYASGTNHTLPTSGYAHAYSGVNIDSFIKKITYQRISPDGVMAIGPTVEIMAEAEDLHAHKLAMTLRIKEASK